MTLRPDGHAKWCKYTNGYPCREFSTDGTATGALIAHSMGTTDEEEIIRMDDRENAFVSDIAAEQADWDSDLLGQQ